MVDEFTLLAVHIICPHTQNKHIFTKHRTAPCHPLQIACNLYNRTHKERSVLVGAIQLYILAHERVRTRL